MLPASARSWAMIWSIAWLGFDFGMPLSENWTQASRVNNTRKEGRIIVRLHELKSLEAQSERSQLRGSKSTSGRVEDFLLTETVLSTREWARLRVRPVHANRQNKEAWHEASVLGKGKDQNGQFPNLDRPGGKDKVI